MKNFEVLRNTVKLFLFIIHSFKREFISRFSFTDFYPELWFFVSKFDISLKSFSPHLNLRIFICVHIQQLKNFFEIIDDWKLLCFFSFFLKLNISQLKLFRNLSKLFLTPKSATIFFSLEIMNRRQHSRRAQSKLRTAESKMEKITTKNLLRAKVSWKIHLFIIIIEFAMNFSG